jgi:hypothetical protein
MRLISQVGGKIYESTIHEKLSSLASNFHNEYVQKRVNQMGKFSFLAVQ